MAAPDFNLVFKDKDGNFYNCGACFAHTFGDGRTVFNVSLATETGEGKYGKTMRLDEAAAKALAKEGFLNVSPVRKGSGKPKREFDEDGDEY